MSASEPEQRQLENLVDRITLLCVQCDLFREVPLCRLNAMLDEITTSLVRCKPDPPGLIK